MKLNLNLEFDSIAEMQDWIVKEARILVPEPVVIEAGELQAPELEPVPVKPKRRRRTKKEMEAARAAEQQAAPEPEPEPAPEPEPVTEAGVELGTEPEPPAEVEAAAPAGGNGSGELAELQKRFLALMSKDPHAAVAELDRVVGPSGKFSQCALEVQKEILAALEARQ